MEKELYQTLYNTESTYWWFTGQRYLLNSILHYYYGHQTHLVLLDIGCGAGLNLMTLSKYGKAYGIDISDDALAFCKKRGLKHIKKSNVMDIQHKDKTFDVVTELGVFYHKAVTDDVKAMKEAYRILKPGGRFIMMDCAMMSLFGKHDIAFQGVRRYSKTELKQKLESAGFTIERITYFNSLLFIPIFIKRKLEKLSTAQPKSGVQESINPVLNKLLNVVYKCELRLLRYVNYPFGINILAIARK